MPSAVVLPNSRVAVYTSICSCRQLQFAPPAATSVGSSQADSARLHAVVPWPPEPQGIPPMLKQRMPRRYVLPFNH
jgi:hypothetical protein